MERYLTPEQVAEHLQLNPQTVRRLLRSGALGGAKVGKVWRIPESSLALKPAKHMGQEARVSAIKAARGSMKHLLSSVDDFLAEKHAEIERENARHAVVL